MNRSVLIVTPYFAPQTHAAVFRAYKLAKLLPRYGWKPYVLTVDRNYLYNEDAGLLADLPDEVDVVTARYVEPTLRGVRMALGGPDRTFSALKAARTGSDSSAPAAPPVAGAGLGGRLYHHLLQTRLQTPDPHWTWYRPAVRAGRELVQRHAIPLVYTTCLPYTCHRIGAALQADGCKWVADFRDPTTYAAKTSSPVDRVYARQRRIERETLRSADVVTGLSSAYPMIFRDMHGADIRDDIEFIPTGVDEELIPAAVEPTACETSPPYVVFSGEYLPEYGEHFLELFALALADPTVHATGVTMLVVGHHGLNTSRMLPMVERLGLAGRVTFRDHVPQDELYRLLRGASAGLLIPGAENHWWNNFAKMVDYIGLGIPVLAHVPDPSEARTALGRANLGIFLDGPREQAARTLADYLAGRTVRPTPVDAECRRYHASSQVESFVQIFERLIESPVPA